MKCPACGAEMHLMQVVLDDALRHAPAIERHVFKCSACPQEARRLLFSVPLGSTDLHPVRRRIPRQAPIGFGCINVANSHRH